ncbi:hypothetical protein LPJ38_25325 [Bradyrhizobium daqingense]|uniref:Uncharacterized protein n=1 Tax=Bradyrhizobium daqingense TaxID=993502 RepID=A0A562KX67_9BRAD|nr:hypothetical protein [Bradyrhizobium daqingense]TWH99783.1 hypothetical protein IQ17_05083 [Bradyrhizobium daqingense]UFS86965.1 hypothetical protein LPJ38_25325 [Bradyrhizobium daqingense]
MNVIVLPDRFRLDARTNLDRLIERARRSRVFAGAVDFDDPVWDLSTVKFARPSARSAHQRKLIFATDETGYVRDIEERTPIAERFASFTKALIVLREEASPKSTKDHGRVLRAARSLYCSMQGDERDPVDLVSADFMAACNYIRYRKTQRGEVAADGSAYILGRALREIAEFINRHSIAKANISFSNPFPRESRSHSKVGKDGDRAREEKMATKEEMGAIVDASLTIRAGDDQRDLLRIAAVELMCCAPVRINEVLDTRYDCRRTERTRREATGEEVQYLGYAYHGSKKAPDSIKWIPSAMVDIADRALADARRITEPYREIARWMERHPGRAYLAEEWRLADPDTLLSAGEANGALHLGEDSIFLWLKANRVKKHVEGKLRCYRLGDLEAAILRRFPKLPPGVKLSDYMFIVPRHYFRNDMVVQNYVLSVLGDNTISDFLGNHKGAKGVFERLGILDANEKPYRINTHSIRHYLNTLAQKGRLSQLDIARWSGRKDVRQNAVYDHSGGIALAQDMRTAIETGEIEGPIVETVASLPPVERDAFLKGRFATAHFTSIGACTQDFSMAPCPSHGACGGCAEHLVVKGKAEHKAEAERLLVEHQAMLDGARAAMAEGTYNASAWVAHNERVVDGLKKTVAVHADPTIPDGTMVQV